MSYTDNDWNGGGKGKVEKFNFYTSRVSVAETNSRLIITLAEGDEFRKEKMIITSHPPIIKVRKRRISEDWFQVAYGLITAFAFSTIGAAIIWPFIDGLGSPYLQIVAIISGLVFGGISMFLYPRVDKMTSGILIKTEEGDKLWIKIDWEEEFVKNETARFLKKLIEWK